MALNKHGQDDEQKKNWPGASSEMFIYRIHDWKLALGTFDGQFLHVAGTERRKISLMTEGNARLTSTVVHSILF